MGQGYSLTPLSAGSAGIDVPELSDLTYEKSMGMARFMKSIRARHHDGLVAVKVAMKPYPNMRLEPYILELIRERKALADVPNALAYDRIHETSTNGFLVRQYLYNSLYDRMSTRPFLEDIEKKWLAFQLLCALRDCHARNVFHGDIKSENVMVTSWNWLYLSDFSAAFKPTYLPEDNPADFSYYFDTSGRRTCYLAPERFIVVGERADEKAKVNWAMDIFSAGCVIAELFLETPTFSLSQLYKYRKGEHDPVSTHLSRIEDKDVREMVSHMIQIEPESRYSADEYLNFWRRRAFPEYFYSFLHQYMALITDPSSGRKPITTEGTNLGEADERIDRVYYDFDKISYFLGYDNEPNGINTESPDILFGNSMVPVHIDIPNNQHQASNGRSRGNDDGTLIFLALVVASLRNTARAVSRTRACDLLLAFAERVTDEAKLDRILPYVVSLANDRTDIVKAAAIRTMTQLMALIKVISPVNAHVFPEYILPRLQLIISNPAAAPRPVVRATYASCIATLANTASRFLDMMQALKADGSLPSIDPETEDDDGMEAAYQNLFDVARSDLVDYFEVHTKSLLTDNDSSVRRAFLGSVSSLCVFFGSLKASEVILSHLNTYLNGKDWMLKCAFFETIVGVGTFVGSTALEEFILPLMVQALTDPEDLVVEKVLRSFASLAELGLFQRSKNWELVDIVGRFTMHPNIWLRQAAASFIFSATLYLSPADNYCIIAPLVQPYLKYPLTVFTELKLLDALQKPLPRPVFDMAVSWATKVNKGIFWKPAKQQRTFSFGITETAIPIISAKDLGNTALSKVPKNDEDEQWLARLRNIGMSAEDEWKLLALRGYIWRMAQLKPREGSGNSASHLNNVINLKQFDITPQTVFFDDDQKSVGKEQELQSGQGNGRPPNTISEALLDAAMTIDDTHTRRKKFESYARSPTTGIGSPASPMASDNKIPAPDLSSSPSSPATVANTQQDASAPAQNLDVQRLKLEMKIPQIIASEPVISDDASIVAEVNGSATLRLQHRHSVRRKGSAVSLMNRKESSKANAEIGTTSANAFGKLEAPHLGTDPSLSPKDSTEEVGDHPTSTRLRPLHSYDGGDPHVLKLLDSLYQEHYPSDIIEFGPLVTPIARRQRIRRSTGELPESPWRPEGGLVALFGEHTAAINRVAIAPDHVFFVTCSDDGTVKIWDTARLERNIAYRSRQTHKHAPGTKVKSLCFLENTHCFASGATDGSIHIVKIDYHQGGGSSRYGKLRLLETYQLLEGEYSVWLEHFKIESHSLLVVATTFSRVLAIDLRTMRTLYVLSNPVHHGALTCFCIDRKRAWLLLGTTHGVLSLWDLRFQVRVKAWGLPGATPIHQISLYPFKGRGRWVCVAGGCGQGEVTVWDIEKTQCREVYRVGDSKDGVKSVEKQYEAWKVDEERSEGMLDRFATALEPSSSTGSLTRGIRSFAVGIDALEDGRESRYGFLITAGSDRKVRFWDLTRIEASTIISGLDADDPRPTFISIQPSPSLIVNSERGPQQASSAANEGSSSRGPPNSSAKRVGGRPPRSTVISLQQQRLLTSHLDSVTDVALLEWPYGMIISVDRSGVIFVFQ